MASGISSSSYHEDIKTRQEEKRYIALRICQLCVCKVYCMNMKSSSSSIFYKIISKLCRQILVDRYSIHHIHTYIRDKTTKYKKKDNEWPLMSLN